MFLVWCVLEREQIYLSGWACMQSVSVDPQSSVVLALCSVADEFFCFASAYVMPPPTIIAEINRIFVTRLAAKIPIFPSQRLRQKQDRSYNKHPSVSSCAFISHSKHGPFRPQEARRCNFGQATQSAFDRGSRPPGDSCAAGLARLIPPLSARRRGGRRSQS